MTRVADPNPAYCSSCFNQQPQLPHVDFEAAWDGPVVNPDDQIKVAIDDLYLCANCVREAGRLLGMVDDEPERIGFLERELAVAQQELTEVKQYAGQLELAVQNAPRRPVRRPPGRPRKDMVEA